MKTLLLAMILSGAVCSAQPLACGKYQHEQKTPGHVIGTWQDICVDDLHVVTEKEWQGWLYVQKTQQDVNRALGEYVIENEARQRKIVARLKALESRKRSSHD